MAPDDPDGVAPSDTDGVAPNDSPWSGVIDQEDERTAGAQAVLDAYVANDPESVAAWFADDANIGFNKERVDKATFIANISKDHTHFKDIEVSSVITTLRYNNGSVFTNLWASWEGTVRETGEERRETSTTKKRTTRPTAKDGWGVLPTWTHPNMLLGMPWPGTKVCP